MKKNIKITLLTFFILTLTLISSLPNATVYASNTSKVDTYNKKYSANKKNEVVCKGEFKGLKMNDNSKLAKAVNSYSTKQFETYMTLWKPLKEFSLGDDMEYTPYWLYETLKVKDGNSKYLSIEDSLSDYSGSAHPNYSNRYITFDKKTGRKISLKNIANCSTKEFTLKVIKRLNKKLPKEYLSDFNESYKPYLLNYKFKDYQFYIKNDKLHIFFNPYEIGPYSMGVMDIVVKL